MGILDGVIGGLVSAAVLPLIQKTIEEHGGVQGIVSQFEKSGFGTMVQSWVGTGANSPVNAEQIQQALGADTLQKLAEKTGLPHDEIAHTLAEALPAAVDKMTPNGAIEPAKAA